MVRVDHPDFMLVFPTTDFTLKPQWVRIVDSK